MTTRIAKIAAAAVALMFRNGLHDNRDETRSSGQFEYECGTLYQSSFKLKSRFPAVALDISQPSLMASVASWKFSAVAPV